MVENQPAASAPRSGRSAVPRLHGALPAVVLNLNICISQTMQTHQSVPHTRFPAECKTECKLKALLAAPTSGYFKRVCRLKIKERSLVETNSPLHHPSHPNWSCHDSKWQARLTRVGWDGTRGVCHLGAGARAEHPCLPSLHLTPWGGREPELSPTVWRAACPHPGADKAIKNFVYIHVN